MSHVSASFKRLNLSGTYETSNVHDHPGTVLLNNPHPDLDVSFVTINVKRCNEESL